MRDYHTVSLIVIVLASFFMKPHMIIMGKNPRQNITDYTNFEKRGNNSPILNKESTSGNSLQSHKNGIRIRQNGLCLTFLRIYLGI